MATTTNSGIVNVATTITFASIVQGGGGGGLTIELDEVKNSNQSQFQFGATAYFKVFPNPQNLSLSHIETAGTVSEDGSFTNQTIVTEQVSFINELTANTKYPINAGTLVLKKWYGTNPGAVAEDQASGATGLKLTRPTGTDPAAIFAGICEVSYVTKFLPYKLTGVTTSVAQGATEFPVAVIMIGTPVT